MDRLQQRQIKKAQGKADYFEKELKVQTEKYKKLQEKTKALLSDSCNICKSYEKLVSVIETKLVVL